MLGRRLLAIVSVVAILVVLSGCGRFFGSRHVPAGLRVELKAAPGSLPSDPTKREAVMKETVDVLQKRVMGVRGVIDPDVSINGTDGIEVTLPGITDPKRADSLLTAGGSSVKTSKLEFYWLKDVQSGRNPLAKWKMTYGSKSGDPLRFFGPKGEEIDSAKDPGKVLREVVNAYDPVSNPGGIKPILTENDLLPTAQADLSPDGAVIRIEFNPAGRTVFRDFTRSHINDVLAIFYNGRIITAPEIREAIPSGKAQISGFKSISEAQDASDLLNAGPLPVPLKVIKIETVPAH